MKQEWKDPRIDVQKFMPNEYATSTKCVYFSRPNILVRLFKSLTDARADLENAWQGDKMGFNDDCFDYLTHSSGQEDRKGYDTLPEEPVKAPNGWYSDTNNASALSSVLEVHQNSKGQLSGLEHYGESGGPLYGYDSPKVEGPYPGDMASVIYFWGDYTNINSTNYTTYGCGPNGS